MPLQLAEVSNEAEFADVVAVEHEAFSNPPNSFWFALRGPSIAECTARQWAEHTTDPKSHWLKVTDSDTQQIAGAAQWVIHETDPFATPVPAATADWWPEGELKDMSNQMMTEFFSHRPHRMNRPHLLIGYCFVSQHHRRRGAGRLLMQWGCKLADEMGLEAFVEATEDGRPLYESSGFVVVERFYLDPKVEEPTEEWTRLKKEIVPQPYLVYLMWRPKGGKFVEGQTVYS